MITLTLLVCMVSNPAHCKKVDGLREPTSFIECLTGSQVAAAQWAADHPAWRVKKIICTIGQRPESHA